MPVADMELGLMGQNEGSMTSNATEPDGPDQQQPQKSKPIVGIIYPPPEVRNIVDKTAAFVARNGPEFESRIKQNELNNPKFNFLTPGDPYHAYYQHKVKEIAEGKTPSISSTELALSSMGLGAAKVVPQAQLFEEAKKKKQMDLLKQVELPFVPREAPHEFEFMADPPSISAHDLDVVKLTAQFVARNGRQFLSTLMAREQKNYQFDFLRPQHSLFQYFTKLLEQYTKVLIPPKDVVKRLQNEDKQKILDDVKYRANWIKHQEAVRRKEEEAAEKERMAYSSIDWHDFVVVETVDYQPFETGHFPPPTTPQEVGARVLLQDRILLGHTQPDKDESRDEQQTTDDTEVQDMEEDSSSSDDDEKESAPVPQFTPSSAEPPREDRVIIKKGYDPKMVVNPKMVARPLPGSGYTISPITGERIPVNKVAEHFRIGLLDPRWKEQRDKQMLEKVNQESVYAQGVSINDSLKQLAERRSDIFGVGVEETQIGKKFGEEEPPPLTWDPSPVITSAPPVSDDKGDDKRDSIGPNMKGSVISSGPQPPSLASMNIQPPGGPPMGMPSGPPPSMPQMHHVPGIVRPLTSGPPPPPGVMLLRPLLGIPNPLGHPPFPFPNTMNRPPLLTSAPAVTIVAPPQPAPSSEDEPAAKKPKTLEDFLIPEDSFLAANPPTTTFSVALPAIMDKPEMNLHGQVLTIALGLSEPITSLKSKIAEVVGLAPSKQKLRMTEGLFFKDSNSLAYYNVGNGAIVHLSLKERGGRKK